MTCTSTPLIHFNPTLNVSYVHTHMTDAAETISLVNACTVLLLLLLQHGWSSTCPSGWGQLGPDLLLPEPFFLLYACKVVLLLQQAWLGQHLLLYLFFIFCMCKMLLQLRRAWLGQHAPVLLLVHLFFLFHTCKNVGAIATGMAGAAWPCSSTSHLFLLTLCQRCCCCYRSGWSNSA